MRKLLSGLLVLLISYCCHAVELPVEHSLDGGLTFKQAGVVEGNFKLRDLTFSRDALSPSDTAQLAELVKADKFYMLRVGGSTAFVRAACFAAPASEMEEKVQLAVGSAGAPAFMNYIVQSPGCQKPAASASPRLGAAQLEIDVQPPTMGPVIYNLLDHSGIDAAPGSGPAGFGAPQPPTSGGTGGSKVGATNRPLGAMPGQPVHTGHGDEAQKEPPSWIAKNWMFLLGGGMVIINLISTAGRIANTPAGTPAPPRGQQ